MTEKGESEKKYLEALWRNPEGLSRVEIRNITGLCPSTEADITRRLVKDNTVKPISDYDEKRKKSVDKYVIVDLENLMAPTELLLLMNLYRSALLDNNIDKIRVILEDIRDICKNKKVRDKEFIEFLVKEAENDNDISRQIEFIKFLGDISTSLLKTIDTKEKSLEFLNGYSEKHLLRIVNGSIENIKKIIFNNKIYPSERSIAFNVLKHFDYDRKYEIAFELLKKLDNKIDLNKPEKGGWERVQYNKRIEGGNYCPETELSFFLPTIQEMILMYAKKNPLVCKKSLYEMITPDSEVKYIAIGLLERIRSESKTSLIS